MQEKQTLPALLKEAHAIEELLIETDGELNPILTEWMTINEVNLQVKVDAYKFVLDKLDLSIEFYKNKEDEIKKIRKLYENQIERMKSNLKNTMYLFSSDELKGIQYRFKLIKSKARVVIENEALLPIQYCREIIKYEPAKDDIKKAIEEGIQVPGAYLDQSYSLRCFICKD